VLLLRDVFDYSAAEVAAALDLHDGNVRTIHHRARRAMKSYERRRFQPTPGNHARADEALRRFLSLLGAGDVRGIERMLAADVNAVTDGGGEFTASLHPIAGAGRVARFFARLAASRPGAISVSIRSINYLPAAWFVFASPHRRRPPRLVLGIDLDAAGLISNVRVIASATKLTPLESFRHMSAKLSRRSSEPAKVDKSSGSSNRNATSYRNRPSPSDFARHLTGAPVQRIVSPDADHSDNCG
jgi:RNA polymerase sigma-70 factor (ECF subfamily)